MRILVVLPRGRPDPARAPPREGAFLRFTGIDFFDLVSVVILIFIRTRKSPRITRAETYKQGGFRFLEYLAFLNDTTTFFVLSNSIYWCIQ